MAIKRPLEVSILAWIVLLVGIVIAFLYVTIIIMPSVRDTLTSLAIHESEQAFFQFSLNIHYLVGGIGAIVHITTAIGLFRAQRWARMTLVVWSTWILLFALLATGSFSYVLPKLIIFCIMIIILFTPRARTYFTYIQDRD